jgi:hypothetical protein
MPFEDNSIDISDLQNVTISLGDLKAIVTVLEAATAHLILPNEVTAALGRLRGLTDKRITP